MRKTIRIVLAFLAIPVVVLLGAWQYVKRTPSYSLRQVAKAIENRDRLAFEKYVAVNRVVEGMVEDLFEPIFDSLNDIRTEPALRDILPDIPIERLKSDAIKATTKAILHAVESGITAESLTKASSSDADAINLAAVLSMDDARLLGVERTERRDDRARAALRVHYESLDTALLMHLRLEKKGAFWQLVSIEDFDRYLSELRKIEDERLAAVNEKTQKEISEFVQLGDIEITLPRSAWSDADVELRISLKNASDVELRNVAVQIRHVELLGDTISFPPIELLASGQDTTLRMNVGLYEYPFLWHLLTTETPTSFEAAVTSMEVRQGSGWVPYRIFSTWDSYRKSLPRWR